MAHNEPHTLCDRAADVAMASAARLLEAEGASLDAIFVTLAASGVPERELNAATAASGDLISEDPREQASDVLNFLVNALVGLGRQVGVRIALVPLGRG